MNSKKLGSRFKILSKVVKILGNLLDGIVFVVSAPAGTGKTTLVKKLVLEFPDALVHGITCTTREKRAVESHGEDYHFVSKEEFLEKKEKGEFLEDANIYGYSYGTLRKTVVENQQKGKHVILVIDTQGAMQIKKVMPAVFIFISPPSLEIQKMRLQERKTETLDDLTKRLTLAKQEITLAEEYDYHIINDKLDVAYDVLRSIIIAEEHKTQRK